MGSYRENAGRTMLIVEDDQLTRSTLQHLIALKYPLWQISSAEDGLAGLASFREKRQEVVLTDICMPGMKGDQMAKEITSLNSSTLVIALTAYSDAELVNGAQDAGISIILKKPLEFKKLFAVLDTYLARP